MTDTGDKSCLFKIERPVYQIQDINDAVNKNNDAATGYLQNYGRIKGKIGDGKCRCNFKNTIFRRIPAVKWLSTYNWKEDFISDLISGFTVAVMNIPQGMAYAMLANVPPVLGIYMAFFPIIVYALLGTSRHISMGSFAVVCLMVGKVVLENTPSDEHINEDMPYNSVQIAATVAFIAGVFQIFMCIFRLNIICALLSDTLVSSFTAGAAIHVLTSQIKDLFGFKIKSYTGSFQLIYTYVEIFHNMKSINLAATTISAVTVLILVFNLTVLKSRLNNRYNVPVPIELIIILIGTIVSKHFHISEMYSLKIVGHIPIGLPQPTSPIFALMPNIALQSFVIAVVAYIVSVSMGMIFAQKLKYELDVNQELLAQGAANIFGSFFSCPPIAASLSRSVIQQTAGGKTQLASIVSSLLLLSVLLWYGPFFEPLPCCILASLIVVALKDILYKVMELPQIWKLSVLDGIVWVTTYLTVVLVEIDIGLLTGLFVSVISLFIQGMKPYTCLLGRVSGTDIYVDKTKYNSTVDLQGIRIIHYAGGLNFANRGFFKNEIYKLIDTTPKKIIERQNQRKQQNGVNCVYSVPLHNQDVQFIILDLSGFHYMDPSGAVALQSLATDFHSIGITIYGAGTSEPVYESFKLNGLMESNLFTLFPTIHDAVLYAQHQMSQKRQNIDVTTTSNANNIKCY